MPHTISDLASILGEPAFRVRYAIQRAGIKPRGKVGVYSVYGDEDVPAIRQALAGIGRLVRPLPPTAEAR